MSETNERRLSICGLLSVMMSVVLCCTLCVPSAWALTGTVGQTDAGDSIANSGNSNNAGSSSSSASATSDSKGTDAMDQPKDTTGASSAATDASATDVSNTQKEKVGDTSNTADASEKELTASSESKTEIETYDLTTAAQTVVDGVYVITSALDASKALDVAAGSMDNSGNIQIYQANGTFAQSFCIAYAGAGYYTIVNLKSGKALDVVGASKEDAANVQQYDSNNTDAQLWAIFLNDDGSYTFINKGSKKALDVLGASTANGANVQQYEPNGTAAQKYSLRNQSSYANIADGMYTIGSSITSNMVIDVSAGQLANGANVQLYSSNGTNAQKFTITKGGNGFYTIESAQSDKALDVSGASIANGANIQQYESNATAAQQWTILQNSDGSYTFINRASGKALDVEGASMANGTNIHQYEANGTDAQKFILTGTTFSKVLSDGCYTVNSSMDYSAVFDIVGGSTSDGANAQVYSFNASRAQKFYFSSVGNGYFTIENVKSGKYLEVESSGSANAGNVCQGDYSGAVSQLWKAVLVQDHYALISKDSGFCIDLEGAQTGNGTNVQTYQANDSSAQLFDFDSLRLPNDGYYSIASSLDSNAVLDIDSASTLDCANVQLWESNGTVAQLFRLASNGDGYYLIYNVNSAKVLDVANAGTADGTNVQQYEYNGTDAQLWSLKGTDDGYYVLTNKGSGKCLDVANGVAASGSNIQILTASGGNAQKFDFNGASYSTGSYEAGTTLDAAIYAEMAVDSYGYSYDWFKKYMDPNGLTSSGSIYQFMRIDGGYSGMTADQINAFIDSTLKGRTGKLHGTGEYFVEASKASKVNEAYLLAHAILETDWGTSALATGHQYNGSTYYNFFGIGAFDADAVGAGSAYAVLQGWNSIRNTVTGGAAWIAKWYTYGSYSQNTLYKMRFNIVDGTAVHQYATDIAWANSNANLISEVYGYYDGVPSVVFDVPSYS